VTLIKHNRPIEIFAEPINNLIQPRLNRILPGFYSPLLRNQARVRREKDAFALLEPLVRQLGEVGHLDVSRADVFQITFGVDVQVGGDRDPESLFTTGEEVFVDEAWTRKEGKGRASECEDQQGAVSESVKQCLPAMVRPFPTPAPSPTKKPALDFPSGHIDS
jgi:hypothetical protein